VAELRGDDPTVAAAAGQVVADETLGQTVSMRLMPASAARSRMASTSVWVKGLPHSPPSCQVPTPTTETLRPVRPKVRYFICS
jgi:hypothetical protein